MLVIAGLVVGMIAAESFVALAIVLLEGTVALAVLAVAALAGGWLVPMLGLKNEAWPDRLIVGTGLGIGGLSLLVLGIGAAGLLTRLVAGVLVGLLTLAGLSRLALDCWRIRGNVHLPTLQPFHWLWVIATPFLAIALLAASLPPGVLWAEEAGGYDVLEYHLAVPKAFAEAGYVLFMPYNVYSNFPSNSEMLSLLMMLLRGDAIEAAFMATIANVGLGMLFVAAAWWAGRYISARAGVIAGVLAAGTPWIAYLAGIAYVEPGMLAMGMLALGAILRGNEKRAWIVAAGLLAGLSCGYKYTAVPLIALPLCLPILATGSTWRDRLRRVALFAAAAVIPFSPWLIRNTLNTGNPVFPLAYNIFGAKPATWDADLQARWSKAHGLEGAAHTDESTAQLFVQRTLGDSRVGPMLLILAAVGIARCRDRLTVALVLMLVLQATIWLVATHLFARFATVMLMPILLLAARSSERLTSPIAWRGLMLAVLAGVAWNLYHLGTLYYHHTRVGPAGEPLAAYGRTDWFVEGQWPGFDYLKRINALGPHSRVMLVGEARTFYIRPTVEYAVVFNHHPLARAVERLGKPDAIVRWLEDRGITHVLVHWGEMHRLSWTYGFEPALNAELFARLEAAGLKPVDQFAYEPGRPPYATLYEVPHG